MALHAGEEATVRFHAHAAIIGSCSEALCQAFINAKKREVVRKQTVKNTLHANKKKVSTAAPATATGTTAIKEEPSTAVPSAENEENDKNLLGNRDPNSRRGRWALKEASKKSDGTDGVENAKAAAERAAAMIKANVVVTKGRSWIVVTVDLLVGMGLVDLLGGGKRTRSPETIVAM